MKILRSKIPLARLLQEQKKLQLLISFHRRSLLTQNFDETLKLLAREIRQLLGADRATVYLMDAAGSELGPKSVSCRRSGATAKDSFLFNSDTADLAARAGRVINIKDVARSRILAGANAARGAAGRGSVLAAPIKNAPGRVLGVLEVIKLSGNDKFSREDEGLVQLVAGNLAAVLENAQLLEQLKRSNFESIYILAQAAEYRDQEDTAHHLKRMSEYSAIIADTMGLGLERTEMIRFASPLHDIGKIAIRDAVLKKPGRFTPQEHEEMRKHTLLGFEMLREARSPLLQLARQIALTHHERFDGAGYPRGLRGPEIPLESKIVALADVFDALSTERIYKPPWPLERVQDHIAGEAGKHFDPQVVAAFQASRGRFEGILSDARS
ncbi:MAG: HD domain-containing phosphohydrolase [Elusimicrobiota bacterium]